MIKLDHQKRELELKNIIISNELVFEYFDKKVKKEDYTEIFLKAFYIGVLALMEDRLSAFFAKTQSELGVELESLKQIFDLKQELFYKSTLKGVAAEEDVAEFLNEYFDQKKIKDDAFLTGSEAGALARNKTGDILVHIDGTQDLKIAIECKFDKSIKLGDIADKDVFTRKTDTAWSQLIETQANREARISIMVFDRSLIDNSILNFTENVAFIPTIGFISVIDVQRGDYSNLIIAYNLARDIAVNAATPDLDLDQLLVIVKRLIRTIDEFKKIRKLVESNIATNQKILQQLEKSHLLMEFNQKYMTKLLKEKTLTAEDLLDFYMAEEVKDKYVLIEKEINDLTSTNG